MALSDLPDVLGLEERSSHQHCYQGETSNMTGVGDQSPSLSQSLAQDMPAMMTQSMCIPSGTPIAPAPDIMTSSTSSLQQGARKGSGLRNQTSQSWFLFDDDSADNAEGRAESAARERDREEKVRRIREQQEDERKRKLEELKAHAQNAQKFREQQEGERRKHIDELRSKDMDRRQQVEERRRDIERSEQERREAILQRNKDREGRLETQRRSSRGNIEFAFGSSAPRLIEPRVDSASGYWGSRRSTSSNNVGSHSGVQSYDRRSQERDQTDFKSKRTASAQGLDRSTEGEENGLIGGAPPISAHRRRTDLVPTIVMRREDHTPGSSSTPRRSPGLSRENSSSSRPGSALSTSGRGSVGGAQVGGVRLRPGSSGGRRPRPMSIATTGMTASMYEERQRPATAVSHVPRQKSSGTPKPDRMKRARSVTSDAGGIDDDNRSTTSSQSVGPARTPGRRTPSQVKAEAAARKAKASPNVQTTGRPQVSTPKSSLGAKKENGQRRATGEKGGQASTSPSPAVSQDNMEGATGGAESNTTRQSTPDILKDNNKKSPSEPKEDEGAVKNQEEQSQINSEEGVNQEPTQKPEIAKEQLNQDEEKEQAAEPEEEELPNNEEVKEKKIITSEEEAKARIAEKRREMKEQKEREAEAERKRLEEEARLEEEQRRKEEEEMRQMERLAEEGRQAEEERIQKAIQEKEEEERRQKEEEEKLRKEKEETEKKMKEEAEKREAELQEKLKKEEEERLARKKRIEEIMARTRGGKGKGDAPTPVKKEEERSESTPPQQPPSLDPMGDPTKPDLIGDISDKVEAENARNLSQSGPSPPSPAEPEVEKGALDSLSLKSEDTENSSPLITIENGVPSKKSNGIVDGSSFDQILDLGDLGDSNKEERVQGIPSPIRAFEENNSQQSNTGARGVKDLLS